MDLNKDFLNHKGKKNMGNTRANRTGFNCGGYALNTFSWYIPNGYYEHSDIMMVESMLKDFPDLRLIQSLDEVAPDEYALAFRKSDTDFHYVKRGDNGRWMHKTGRAPKICYMKQEDVFGKPWCEKERPYDPYNGKVFLFAKKKPAKVAA